MKVVLKSIAGVALLGAASTSQAGESACYVYDLFYGGTYLTAERVDHNVITQMDTYSVHAADPYACDDYLATGTGTAVLGAPDRGDNPYGWPAMGYMGLDYTCASGDGYIYGEQYSKGWKFHCWTDEMSATPDTWYCEGYNDWEVYFGNVNLYKVGIDDPNCRFPMGEEGPTAGRSNTPRLSKPNAR